MAPDQNVKRKFDLLSTVASLGHHATRNEFSTLLALALRAHEKDGVWVAWPTQARIAADCGDDSPSGRKRVQKGVSGLRRRGWLSTPDAQRGQRLTYQLTLPTRAASELAECAGEEQGEEGDPPIQGLPVEREECHPRIGGGVTPGSGEDSPQNRGTIIINESSMKQSIESELGRSAEQVEMTVAVEPKATGIKELFAYWQEKTGRKKSRLDKTRERDLAKAIATYGLQECKLAIDGMAKDDFAMGRDRDRAYNEPKHAFSKAERFEHFRSLAEPEPTTFDFGAYRAEFNNLFERAFSKLAMMDGDERTLMGFSVSLAGHVGESTKSAALALCAKKIAAKVLENRGVDEIKFYTDKEIRCSQIELEEETRNDEKRTDRRRNRKSHSHAQDSGPTE